MSKKKETTLRLNMPQWQGGNVHDYYFGSQLLAWLAPAANGPVETVPVPEPKLGETVAVENGLVGRAALIQQARAARQASDFLAGVPRGRMMPDQVVRLLQDVAAACDMVGLAIAEYLPWEAISMRNLLRQLPLLAE